MNFSPTRLRPRSDGETIPPNLILLSDGASPPPAGWSLLTPEVSGSYLAVGNEAGRGGSAAHGHAATAAHAHVAGPHHAHRFGLGDGPPTEEDYLEGDGTRVFGASHSHSSNDFSDAASGATANGTTTALAPVANELAHCEVLLVKNTGGAWSTEGLFCFGLDAPIDAGWRGVGAPGGPAASFAGRFLKLVEAEPSATPVDVDDHVHEPIAHHEQHATFDHAHGPATERTVTLLAADPDDVATDATASSGAVRAPAQSHSHTATLAAHSIDAASPAVVSTSGTAEAVDAAATLDRFVVALFKAVRNAGMSPGVCALWDSNDGDVPRHWEAVVVAATHNAPYVQIRGEAADVGELPRTRGPNAFAAEHRHALAEHGHATSAVSSAPIGEPPLTDQVAAGSETSAPLAPALCPVVLQPVDDAELAETEASWSTTPADDAHLPLFERFVLIRKR